MLETAASHKEPQTLSRWEKFLALDWLQMPQVFLLAALFIIFRIPLIGLGFGEDPDAWRIANTAYDLRYSHIYHVSRLPGFPLPEFVNAAAVGWGWTATNSLTMLISLASVFAFAGIIRGLQLRNQGLLVLTYAFLPILVTQSTVTLDYMWSLSLLLFSWYFLLSGRNALAGICFGLAVASRLSAACLLVPWIFLLWATHKKAWPLMVFALSAALSAIPLYIPVALNYSGGLFTPYRADVDSWGLFSQLEGYSDTLALAGACILAAGALPAWVKTLRQKKTLSIFCSAALLIIFGLFFCWPYEIEYLLPALPFLLVLGNDLVPRRRWAVFCLYLILNSAITFGVWDRRHNFHPVFDGALKQKIVVREQVLTETQNLIRAVREKRRAVFIVRWRLPVIAQLDRETSTQPGPRRLAEADARGLRDYAKDLEYRSYLSPQAAQEFQARGYTVYYTEEARDLYPESPERYGWKLLEF